MILVLARKDDADAAAVSSLWKAQGALALAPEDLSRPGWRYEPGRPEAAIAVAGGRRIPARLLRGVVTRIAGIHPQDLPRLAAADRSYAAAEMTAFLAAWLSELSCPVINRPSPTCLMGPSWSFEDWSRCAVRAGCRVEPVHVTVRRAGRQGPGQLHPNDPSPTRSAMVAVACGKTFGDVDGSLTAQAQRLAGLAGVEYLNVAFRGPEAGSSFLCADPRPDLFNPQIATALLDRFQTSNEESLEAAV